jgi:hypothetical protein
LCDVGLFSPTSGKKRKTLDVQSKVCVAVCMGDLRNYPVTVKILLIIIV